MSRYGRVVGSASRIPCLCPTNPSPPTTQRERLTSRVGLTPLSNLSNNLVLALLTNIGYQPPMTLLPSATVRTAIELKNAIDIASERLKPLGTCSALTTEWKQERITYGEDEDEDEDEGGGIKALIKQLGEIKQEEDTPFFRGTLDAPFGLTITREGCNYSGEIAPADPKEEAAGDSTTILLKRWFEGAAISGYGDMEAQETKVNPDVRDAREIPATEFTVTPELLDSKIHLYGPGGIFKEHRDTPETDLVGTFLVGLGDTTNPQAGLFVRGNNWEWEHSRAEAGSWVAFYPDIKHEVSKIEDGYRGVIAFKIFRPPGEVEDPTKYPAQAKVKSVLDKMPRKYGLLLERKYCKGTTQLSGFDAQLLAAAKTRGDVVTHVLPVLIKFDVCADEYDGAEFYLDADVFPLTDQHVDALVKFRNEVDSDEEDECAYPWREKPIRKEPLPISLKGTESAWIEERKVSKIEFYSPDLSGSFVTWRRVKQEGAEHTGNEAMPTTEDSIYLSYAMVVLPKLEKRTKEDAGLDD
ncbi:hypothetical protein JB92DRAFT_3141911 [Gautieria morchelliformis]|nr:hypothetical protein JB92DRAFT_3141911 [Gautieria morchelliformis]